VRRTKSPASEHSNLASVAYTAPICAVLE